MTVVNASGATEAVFITLASNQFAFDQRDGGGTNFGTTRYSWLTTGGDDVQVTGTGINTAGDPATQGVATLIEIDLSNNDFADPDVVISGITRPNAFGNPFSNARMSVITGSAQDFFNEILALDDQMTGSSFNDTFKAGGGADTLNMGAGDDSAFGGDGDDVLNGGSGNDSLRGEAGDDELNGGSGADTLNGGTGADAMNGGTGNDVYTVDNAGDTAAESAIVLFGGGVDLVNASVSHALSANLENLTLTGTAFSATGNAKANILTGNASANNLIGGGANDTLVGGAGADFLDGGTGADAMDGGTGNDRYVVDDAGDTISDSGGIDTVLASTSFGLSGPIENLTLTGAGANNGTGTAFANVLVGNGAANVLLGLAGADTLRGGGGADTLVGDANADVFDYDLVSDSGPAAAARDTIIGFDGAGAAVGDVINLAGIDADTTVAGNQAFAFLGQIQNPTPPATAPGSLWLRNSGVDTIVLVNIDGDDAPEMAITINDGATVAADYVVGDFVL